MLNGVYYVKNAKGEMIEVVHIAKFASIVGLTLPTARNLRVRVAGQWDKRRPLKCFNDDTTIWVSTKELTGYPFYKGQNVYHYDKNGFKHLCEQCTFGTEICAEAREAADVEMPDDC